MYRFISTRLNDRAILCAHYQFFALLPKVAYSVLFCLITINLQFEFTFANYSWMAVEIATIVMTTAHFIDHVKNVRNRARSQWLCCVAHIIFQNSQSILKPATRKCWKTWIVYARSAIMVYLYHPQNQSLPWRNFICKWCVKLFIEQLLDPYKLDIMPRLHQSADQPIFAGRFRILCGWRHAANHSHSPNSKKLWFRTIQSNLPSAWRWHSPSTAPPVTFNSSLYRS